MSNDTVTNLPPAETLPTSESPKVEQLVNVIPLGVRSVICKPTETYYYQTYVAYELRMFAFSLPAGTDSPAVVKFCKTNANWLGRDDEELRAHVCRSEHGTIIMQPYGPQWKANLFIGDRITFS
jgi:hypothetical protein